MIRHCYSSLGGTGTGRNDKLSRSLHSRTSIRAAGLPIKRRTTVLTREGLFSDRPVLPARGRIKRNVAQATR
jgi:hypothetical protein